jgi:hypothetical protein
VVKAVMTNAPAAVERATRDFLDGFTLIELDQAVALRAVALRRDHRLKLPDAIIWASAQVHAMLLEPISIGLERERGGGVVDIFPEMEMIDGAALFGRSA